MLAPLTRHVGRAALSIARQHAATTSLPAALSYLPTQSIHSPVTTNTGRRSVAQAAATPPLQRVLVTGALGQIGSELVDALRTRVGTDNVIASDLRGLSSTAGGPFVQLSVTDETRVREVVEAERIDTIYHLAALLSVTGEANPKLCEDINIGGTSNVLHAAREFGCRVFMPSSIAVFGPDTPRTAPQYVPLAPTTVYGRTKVIGEEMALRYWKEHRVDVRGIRYPGLISYKAPPGGGTTDYAVAIFHEALATRRYQCFVRPDTILPMMYIDDAIRATLMLMDAPAEWLGDARAGYNVAGCSFRADELVASIRRHLPDLEVEYVPDARQVIADSWSDALDDSVARQEWGWQAEFTLDRLVDAMFEGLDPEHRQRQQQALSN